MTHRPQRPPAVRVALAIVRRDSRWLVARRRDDVHLGGLWEFPGGKCEPGETAEQAAVRELLEECDVVAEVERCLPELRHDYEDRTVTLTPVLCRWLEREARPLGSVECRWVTLDELEAFDMLAANAVVLAVLRDPPA